MVNGEFYEYEKLYRELAAEKFGTYHFQSASDSELLIALYEREGINCFSYLRGEFAFVLYDSTRQLLLAATDRFGIKPLFWTIVNNRLLIASEAKAFLPLGWKPQWDVRSIVEDGWLHDERTLFRGVRKVCVRLSFYEWTTDGSGDAWTLYNMLLVRLHAPTSVLGDAVSGQGNCFE